MCINRKHQLTVTESSETLKDETAQKSKIKGVLQNI